MSNSSHEVTMGLGEALSRMMQVELNRRSRIAPAGESMREFQMIIDALNVHQLTFNVDCNEDAGAPGIDVFKRSAQTSCCRINTGAHASARGGSRR
jgi:hypothetical protein